MSSPPPSVTTLLLSLCSVAASLLPLLLLSRRVCSQVKTGTQHVRTSVPHSGDCTQLPRLRSSARSKPNTWDRTGHPTQPCTHRCQLLLKVDLVRLSVRQVGARGLQLCYSGSFLVLQHTHTYKQQVDGVSKTRSACREYMTVCQCWAQRPQHKNKISP